MLPSGWMVSTSSKLLTCQSEGNDTRMLKLENPENVDESLFWVFKNYKRLCNLREYFFGCVEFFEFLAHLKCHSPFIKVLFGRGKMNWKCVKQMSVEILYSGNVIPIALEARLFSIFVFAFLCFILSQYLLFIIRNIWCVKLKLLNWK